jgi:hypothetical protein
MVLAFANQKFRRFKIDTALPVAIVADLPVSVFPLWCTITDNGKIFKLLIKTDYHLFKLVQKV